MGSTARYFRYVIVTAVWASRIENQPLRYPHRQAATRPSSDSSRGGLVASWGATWAPDERRGHSSWYPLPRAVAPYKNKNAGNKAPGVDGISLLNQK
jgi:hypothetical protein